MTEEHPPELDRSIPARLRPLVARLLEIQRKCGSLGPRNEEARDMAARLQAIIAELSGGDGDGLPPPRCRELARQLFPVARLFESLGFMSVAREVSHVERLLREMDPDGATPPPPAPAPTPAPPVEARQPAPAEPSLPEVSPPPQRSPKAVVLGLAVLVLAVVAAVVVVIRSQAGRAPDRSLPVGSPVAGGSAAPGAQTTTAARTPAGARSSRAAGSRARLADLIGQARLALQAGDLDRATDLLNEAAAVDVEAGVVRETAQELVTALVERSDQAAGNADWERAAGLLERARDLALRFDLSTRPIDKAVRRQGGLERYRRLGPQDISALQAAIGSRVIVFTDGATREGRLLAVTGGSLRLQLGLDVADDGTLLHTSEVPLASVHEVRVYPD
ncbi:MAG: hypothetical protein C3F15_11560 [Holophagae bacterium]|nr:MAG: hypothetical protein C3F15_11560 [Holophagae bacterium]